PIKEQVEEYNTNLKMFKDTTSLLELAMMTRGMHSPHGVGCSKLILRFNKPWCSRTIAELNKTENSFLLHISLFLNLIETHYNTSSCTCTYFLPHLSQTEPFMEAVIEQRDFLYKIGVFEVMIDDIPIMMEDKNKSFTFEETLQEAHQNDNQSLVYFLLELHVSLSPKNDSTDLIIASRRGDFLTIQSIIEKKPNFNFQNNDGWTALTFASQYGHHQVVELLLNKNPDINIQNKNGWTALMLASRYGHHQVVEFLLSKDPDINIQNNNGWTALMFASQYGYHQVVELLLNKDPDIKIQNKYGWTALMVASSNGHHQVIELLLSKDSDINIKDNDGWTALMVAAYSRRPQVVELLLSKDPNINIRNNDGGTALMIASTNGHHEVVELLLSKDPDINIQHKYGGTALMIASAIGHHQVVKLLLSKVSDINIQNNDGWTALMLASGNGHHQVVELLLSKDPDINIQNNVGGTALMIASAIGHHQVVKLLLSKDPDINIQNNDGETALMLASANGHHQVVKLLLCKDPDINIQNKDGLSAFSISLIFSNYCITKMLVSVPDISLDQHAQLLDKARSGNYIKILKLLLDSHPNHIHTIDDKKLHSLAVAAGVNNFDAVEILIKKCDITSEHIISAFTVACYGGHSSMIYHLSEKIATLPNNEKKLLVAAAGGDLRLLISMINEVGMSPDTPLVTGTTPLIIAASCGHIELVEALIQAGADVNKRNGEGMNVLDIVYGIDWYDRSDIKQLLSTPAKKPNLATASVKTLFGIIGINKVKSFMKKIQTKNE
uniref:Uncharacterized protein n=1 Tax=Amphimedon queenslandica TaxID=400682 RepID=A0A1X7TTN2_AMPQE